MRAAGLSLKKRPFLADVLVEMGLISSQQALECYEESQRRKIRLGQVLLEKNLVKEVDLTKALAKQYDLQYVDLRTVEPSTEALNLIPHSFATQSQFLPVSVTGTELILAVHDPSKVLELNRIEKMTSKQIELVVATEKELRQKIESAYLKHQAYELKKPKADKATELPQEKLTLFSTAVGTDQVGEIELLANRILENAISHRASDIHIEPHDTEMTVRERIDGRLSVALVLPLNLHPGLTSRFKIMGGLDIAEKRVPQDGRFMHMLGGRSIDFRLSTLPTVRGEKVVVRILDKGSMKLGLPHLGLRDSMVTEVRSLLSHPHGLILVSGPTGSGKTTTVYSMLDEIKSTELNILTIEDPVEYKFDIINQVQVNTKAGLTFAGVLRNVLRQDPDVIMVGEIRDSETAEIAIRAALTGHLVISTIHTNDALSAVTRLTDMGIDPFLISASLLGVVAQRLVRKLCKTCHEISHELNDNDSELAKAVFTKMGVLYRPKGCPDCHQSGYVGREGIYEVLKIDRQLRSAISERAPIEKLRSLVEKSAFYTMRDHGVEKVNLGITSIEEVLRSTLDMSS